MPRVSRRRILLPALGLLVCALLLYAVDRSPAVDWSAIDYGLGPSPDSVFKPETLLTFSLEVADSDWKVLRSNPKAEKYVPAFLQVGTEEVGKVGLRFKGGSDSLRDLELDSARLPKLSLKLRFDEYRKGARFHGIRRINLHAMRLDASLLRDRMSYDLLRSFGVAAPRCSHAQVIINGQLKGLYAMVEQVDEVFVGDRFGSLGSAEGSHDGSADVEGQLYKEAWPDRIDMDYFESHLKSSKKRADHSMIHAFARALLTRDDTQLVAEAGRWTDLDGLLRHAVADQAIVNWDGPFGWSGHRDSGFQNHNYYWFVGAASKRFCLISWDLDRTLRPQSPSSALPAWYRLDLDRSDAYLEAAESQFRAASLDPLTRALALYSRGRREAVVREFLAGPFSESSTDARLDAWATQIRAAVKRDKFLSGGFGMRRLWLWEAAIDQLRGDLTTLRERISDSIRPR